MASDIDTIRERHQGEPYCGYIDPIRGLVDHGFTADCDTRIVLDALDDPQDRELLAYLDTSLNVQSKGDIKGWVGQMKNEVSAARADAERLAEALREHTRYLNDENDDPLLEGHSIGCRIIQRPTDDNKHTTGSQHVGDCAANHRHLVEALRLHDAAEDDEGHYFTPDSLAAALDKLWGVEGHRGDAAAIIKAAKEAKP